MCQPCCTRLTEGVFGAQSGLFPEDRRILAWSTEDASSAERFGADSGLVRGIPIAFSWAVTTPALVRDLQSY